MVTRKKVWRYYCDFCDKANCCASAMHKHEKHCTANPNRECGMCKCADFETKPIKALIGALGNGDKQGVNALREKAEGCPACMLAAIRQSGLQDSPLGMDGTSIDFNFKNERIRWWESKNKG